MKTMRDRIWIHPGAVILTMCLGIVSPNARGEPSAGLVPLPVTVDWREGAFTMTATTGVAAEGDAAVEARKLTDALAPALGFRLRLMEQPAERDCITLTLDASVRERLGEEGYELEVGREKVTLRAAGPAGLFYGNQTLRQLLPAAVFGSQPAVGVVWQVPCVRIVDHPRFGWRGLLIDPARHFIPVSDFERYLDVMAGHKFNRLQIHLTDDQGWRIEIRKYPELVRVGSVMDFTALQRGAEAGRQTGGYYSQDDIRHLVRYAAARHITLVPEIEMPAHTGAAIVSYPMLGLYPERLAALPPEKRWTVHEGVLAPRPDTVSFMQDVLAEVLELFPSRHIHIGGDEANIDHWKKSAEMQAFIRDRGLKDEAGLHSWFIRQMDEFLATRGRQLIGWDEILQGGLAPGAVVMSWRGEEGGITAARAGHDVVMAPTSHTYFDYYQGAAEKEPKAIGGFVPLEKVFRYEPIPSALGTDQARHVLGAQAQLWGEYISTPEHRMYMTYPRAAALAEVLWSPKADRDYDGFLQRLASHGERLKQLHVPYRPW
jgi:hexosaminidase